MSATIHLICPICKMPLFGVERALKCDRGHSFDFAKSGCGTNPDKLEERPPLYYRLKHVSQFILPDFMIVTDDTEKKMGFRSKDGIKGHLENLLDIMND